MIRFALAFLTLLVPFAPLAHAGQPLHIASTRLEFPSGGETISGTLAYPGGREMPSDPVRRPAIVLVHK